MTSVLVSVFILLFTINLVKTQISFPEHYEMNKIKKNTQGRLPVYSPANCKENELLYPGDQNDDWICDCAPGAVYYPESDSCYPVFKQGPCKKGQMLVLGTNKIIPECIENACNSDGKVKIRNVCYELGSKGPCPLPELSYVIGVDITTLKLDCVKLSIDFKTRFGEEETPTAANRSFLGNYEICARGTKRAMQGRCPEVK